MEVKKGDGAVLKIGDRFKDKTTGKIYIIISRFLFLIRGVGKKRTVRKRGLRWG